MGFLWNVPFLFVDHPLGLVELWSLLDSYENRVALFLMPCFFILPWSRECRVRRYSRVTSGERQGSVGSAVTRGNERLRSSLRRNGARTLKFMLEKHCSSIWLQIVSSRLGTRKEEEVSVGSGFVFSSHLCWFWVVFDYISRPLDDVKEERRI